MGGCAGISKEHIFQTGKFWELDSGSLALDVKWHDKGYRTLINGYCEKAFYEERLEKLAICLSQKLGSDIVIGDYRENIRQNASTGQYIVCKPDGSTTHAVEVVNSGYFDVAPSGDGKRGQSETCKQKACHEIQA